MTWDQTCATFTILAEPFTTATLRDGIVTAIARLEDCRIDELTHLLAAVRVSASAKGSIQ